MAWNPGSFDLTVAPGMLAQQTLTIDNTGGTGPLYFILNLLDSTQPVPPPALAELPVPGLPRLDPQLISDLESAEDGRADFVVVLGSQADLHRAGAITAPLPGWKTAGQTAPKVFCQGTPSTAMV